jgi:protein-S-isoprenylcysteine O-methyltransferase Ste14
LIYVWVGAGIALFLLLTVLSGRRFEKGGLRRTLPADLPFLVSATLVWVTALMLTAWDFVENRGARFQPSWWHLPVVLGLATGLWLRWRARRALGRQFAYSLRLVDDHALVTGGIYSRIRHPAYTGDLLFHLFLPLLFNSWIGSGAMLFLIPCFIYRIRVEERLLVERFGETYRAYQQRSWRLLPFIF